jgi:hypothetical protein
MILTHDKGGGFYVHKDGLAPDGETLVCDTVRYRQGYSHEALLDGKWVSFGGQCRVDSPIVMALKAQQSRKGG